MGDDFDLFPKRENLDPFSFGKKDKKGPAEGQEPEEDIFGSAPSRDVPGAGSDRSAPPRPGTRTEDKRPGHGTTLPLDLGSPGPDLPSAGELESPTGEPSDEGVTEPAGKKGKRGKKTRRTRSGDGRKPSPFVIVGGALVIILLALYGTMQFMSRKKPAPTAPPAPVSVAVPAPKAAAPSSAVKTVAPPAPAPAQTAQATAAATPPAPGPAKPEASVAVPTAIPSPPPAETVRKSPASPAPAQPAKPVAAAPKSADQAPPAAAEQGRYSVQVGALILKSSVKELEDKLKKLGYQPFFKVGTTMARMNLLTVGPFATLREAQGAVSRLREAGIDADLRQRAGGGAVVYAGSYLLRENAEQIMQRIRSFGYPVQMSEREVQVPMTFVRVGRYETMDEAVSTRGKLKTQGFDAIVVKLQ